MPINIVLSDHNSLFIYLSMATFVRQWQSWANVPQSTAGPENLKYLMSIFTEKVCQPLTDSDVKGKRGGI